MRWLREQRARRLDAVVKAQESFYAGPWSAEQVRAWQLERLNEQWETWTRHAPYYRRMMERGAAPRSFSSWEEFAEKVPVLDKATIRSQGDALRVQTREPELWRVTGGTTAEPVQLPAWKSENRVIEADVWYARSWFGLSPRDRLFLLWGHSHLLGKGLRGWVNARRRQILDQMLGYLRFSAYDLSEEGLRGAGQALLRFRPAYVLGYAVALDRFARVNQDLRGPIRELGIRLAIATGESFPSEDSAGRIEDLLGCPVRMEYGAVETGLIAHQTPEGHYAVLWRHQVLETRAPAELPGAQEILVTSLTPRCFPLVRYALGDLLVPLEGADTRRAFASVSGRCNDWVELSDGMCIHSEAFTHSIRDVPGVLGYQVVQHPDGRVEFRYLAGQPLPGEPLDEIRRRLRTIHPELSRVELVRVARLEQTRAGKTRGVVRLSASPDAG